MADGNYYEYPPKYNNVKSFFKRFGRIIVLVIAVIVVLSFAFDSFYTIKEQEQAVVITFGKARPVNTAGLHFKLPIIQKVKKVDTTIQGLSIGYDMDTDQRIEN